MGVPCRYDGTAKPSPRIVAEIGKAIFIPVCPELLAGLPVPREPVELKGGRAITFSGRDLTARFVEGARKAADIARRLGVDAAVVKQGSPSCGCGKIYDGSFRNVLTEGDGIMVRLLKKEGLTVVPEELF
jgi:uncharacterized protein YbbK (DUF523 family)